MDAVALFLAISARCAELREHDRHASVVCSIADVVLHRTVVGRMYDELVGVGVIRRRRTNRLHVGPVARLGHGEAAGQAQRDDIGDVGAVMTFRAEVQDRAAEQSPLHARLHEQRQVAERLGLERSDGSTDLPVAAELLGEQQSRARGVGERFRLLQDTFAVLLYADPVDGREQRLGDRLPDFVANPRPPAVEEVPERADGGFSVRS